MLVSNSLEQIYSKFAESSNLPSRMHCPRIVKVCLNVGLGKARYEEKFLESTLRDLSLIAGQKAVVTYAKKSIASFKLRQGFPVGCRVTLRRSLMCSFIDRLLYVALPDEKDFRGFSTKSFGGGGNLSFGIKEHIIFPEINYDNVYKTFGMDVTVVTTAKNTSDAKSFLSYINFPFVD